MINRLNPRLQKVLGGRWRIYLDDIDPADDYLIAVDCASGNPGRNASVIQILSQKKHEQVAVLEGQISPEEIAFECQKAGWLFNQGEIIVELEKHGGVVLNMLVGKYPRIYRHRDSAIGFKVTQTLDFGWNPARGFRGASNRQIAIDLLARDLGFIKSLKPEERAKAIILHDKPTVLQMFSFVRDKKTGKEQAASGKFDALVSALYIVNFVYHERERYKFTKVPEREKTLWEKMQAVRDMEHSLQEENRTFGGETDE